MLPALAKLHAWHMMYTSTIPDTESRVLKSREQCNSCMYSIDTAFEQPPPGPANLNPTHGCIHLHASWPQIWRRQQKCALA